MRALCICCDKKGYYSILLVESQDVNESIRYYIPNQNARGVVDKEVWFCKNCMRRIEDNLRATILYLQNENE